MSYSIEGSAHACYEGTSCLVNHLGIQDDRILQEVEGAYCLRQAGLLERNPMPGWFDFEHYKAIHRFLFGDIYGWAGQIRDVDISRQGTRFVPADEIERVGGALFGRIQKSVARPPKSMKTYARTIAEFYHEVNMLHPFREGNGRTQRAFFAQLIRGAGYEIDFAAADRDLLTIAVIQSANGVMDHLRAFFVENLTIAGKEQQ